jgi:RNA polymerase sigma factor for flagellar operon FliA
MEENIEEIINKFKHNIVNLANKLASNYEDDLTSAGLEGLANAFKSFDKTKGTQFTTFAWYRIKGAMLDELRKIDWFHKKGNEYNRDNLTMILFSDLNDSLLFNTIESTEDLVIKREEYDIIKEIVDKKLDTRHSIIIKLLYWSGIQQKEVAELLSISPARVAQLKNEAIEIIKKCLE